MGTTEISGVDAGSFEKLQADGMLLTKVGSHGVCVFWHQNRVYAVDDRCPHLGFPLHRGTVEQGLLTCHWHHARFDLCSGGTLDPFADDVRTYPISVVDGRVVVGLPPDGDRGAALLTRLDDGLEQGLTLVTAKATLGLLDADVPAAEIVERGVAFGAPAGAAVPGSASSWPWPISCLGSTLAIEPWRSSMGWRSSPGTPADTLTGFPCPRCRRHRWRPSS